MKTITLLVSILCFTCLIAQEKHFTDQINDYNEVLNSNKNKIYSLNKNEFDALVKANNNHDFHLVYSFATWCKPCVEFLPKLLGWVESNTSVKLYILNIEKDGNKRLLDVKNFLFQNHKFTSNTYMVSEEYGKGRWRKYDAFVSEMAPGHEEYGMSLLLLYDKNGKSLYASTYNETSEEQLLKITNNINQ